MRIIKVEPAENYTLHIISEDGKTGIFDVKPYLDLEAFQKLNDPENFSKITNGGYFIEWDCGTDLSADTIDAHLKPSAS